MQIFRRIFLSNYWWQESDIWSQASYYVFNVTKNQQSRQTGSSNLMGPKTLPTIWGTYMKLVTKYQISAINSCWEKCDDWWQESDIWSQASYRYAILWESFLDPSDSYFLFADLVVFYTHWTYMRGYHKLKFKDWKVFGSKKAKGSIHDSHHGYGYLWPLVIIHLKILTPRR
jgi:hypothetical protein